MIKNNEAINQILYILFLYCPVEMHIQIRLWWLKLFDVSQDLRVYSTGFGYILRIVVNGHLYMFLKAGKGNFQDLKTMTGVSW